MKFPKGFLRLIEVLKKLPGIGEKTAEKSAFVIVKNGRILDELITALNEIKKLKLCSKCNTISEREVCEVCSDLQREKIIMVVESPYDMYHIEKLGVYNGKYHVIGGLISPLEGIEPKDLFIDNLKNRILEEDIKEVIIALSSSIEGDATGYYIYEKIKDTNINITQIARGIPTGYEITYTDNITLQKAIILRQPFITN
ncbi:MAG: recombination mediator RecR [candidate division WOR-3 bacterium]|nr:recombination mediator RecR [candidate division WOR-3 bacterium]MCX7947261.1 recombination mediator RecR [candidate division WOR-3 bacterium]MDW8150182.1 recombination mediator RecR [candidate division WOR-3 bacterium]